MKNLLFIIVLNLCYVIGHSQTLEEKLNNNVFKIELKLQELPKPHGVDPPKEELVRKIFGKELPKGSAFLYQYNGKKVLITSMHIVERAKDLKGSMIAIDGNGVKYNIKKAGGDTFYDIAVLEFTDTVPKTTGLSFSKKPVRLEQTIKPVGILPEEVKNITIKKGIISGRQADFEKQIGGYGYWKMDLTLEQGMSGGPVLNTQNQIVGINARVRTVNDEATSISYMLDGLIAERAIQNIIKYRRIPRAFIGIVFEQKKFSKDKTKSKVTIHSLIKNYPASAYKELGDYYDGKSEIVVSKINGTIIQHLNDIYPVLENIKPRNVIQLTLSKNGQPTTFDIKANTLESDGLIEITDHFFKNQSRFQLIKANRYETEIRDTKPEKDIYFEAILGGNGNNNTYYTITGKQEIGIVIRLCSDLGSINFLTWTEEKLKTYNISNNNNNLKYTSYLLYF